MAKTTRRSFLKRSSAAAAAALGISARAAEARPPNVVFLLADDLRPDGFAALGNPVVKTPNLDALVNRGCCFRKAYTMGSMVGAVCLPSRTMILTGRSLFRAENVPSGGPASYTFPRAMKEAGYATMQAGKYGNSPRKITDEFDETSDPGQAAQVADRAVDFIRRKAGQAPLFVYMAGMEPHDPQYAPDEFYAMYPPGQIPLPAAFAPVHPFDNGEMEVRDELTLPFPRTAAEIRAKLARYYASISYLDAEFGRVVQALKETGEYERTIFVLAGDNGLSLGEHGLLGKQNLYEFGGMHAPLVFAGPGIPRADTATLTYLMDVFPTVCGLTGTPVPGGVEGLDLSSVVRKGETGPRKWLYTAYGKVQRAITDGRWKLIRYPLIDKTQLFDLGNDPRETHDLAAGPEHASMVRALLDQLSECQREYGDAIPLHVAGPQPAAWSPAQLTPRQIEFQIEETARCRGEKP